MRLLWLCSWIVIGCAKGPVEIAIGQDVCDHCRMVITDIRFAAEIVNQNGKVFKFDSIECMVAHRADVANIHSLWVQDFLNPSEWIEAHQAVYLKSENLPSPMGGFLSAYAQESAAAAAREQYGGLLRTFDQLKADR
jgi:copper chaperone NosL